MTLRHREAGTTKTSAMELLYKINAHGKEDSGHLPADRNKKNIRIAYQAAFVRFA
jgi:hypothetical protein